MTVDLKAAARIMCEKHAPRCHSVVEVARWMYYRAVHKHTLWIKVESAA